MDIRGTLLPLLKWLETTGFERIRANVTFSIFVVYCLRRLAADGMRRKKFLA